VYGEEVKGQKVDLRPSPVVLPKSRLLPLLGSLLRVRDLVMVEEAPGLFRILRVDQTTRSVSAILGQGSVPDAQSMRLVTHVLKAPSGKLDRLSEALSPFLSSAKSALIPVPERGLLIVTDYESRISLLRDLIAVLDAGRADVSVRPLAVVADAATLAAQVNTVLADAHRVRQSAGVAPSVRGDLLPGSLVVIGTAEQAAEAQEIVSLLTPPTIGVETRSYAPRYLSTDRAHKLVEGVLFAPGTALTRPAAVYDDALSGRLFITADPETHQAIQQLLEREDKPLPESDRPLRSYRPRHRKAVDLLATLTQLLGQAGRITTAESPPALERASAVSDSLRTTTPGPVQPPPMELGGPRLLRIEGADYVITVDESTNSLLAIGTREFHAQVESLVADLDRRRAQVLIEMTLVAITFSDSLSLGVELESLDLGEAWDYLVFSNFGLSTLDVATGQRTLIPGIGGNGVLLRPDQVPFIIRTLATRANARVVSTPKLLVGDNARGVLRNVDEAPFTSVNASDTVATTSFGGFESAGTTLSVTPHIAEGDHLTLEYELTFSNFTGTAAGTSVPPPRTTNSFTSTVEVPDGHTIVTGGLVVENQSDSVDEIPFVGRIPLLGKLFQSSSKLKTRTKIFAFIRPTILRADPFEELKLFTMKDIEAAGLVPQDPALGEPMWMR
jgi:general secretion pathway protein D